MNAHIKPAADIYADPVKVADDPLGIRQMYSDKAIAERNFVFWDNRLHELKQQLAQAQIEWSKACHEIDRATNQLIGLGDD